MRPTIFRHAQRTIILERGRIAYFSLAGRPVNGAAGEADARELPTGIIAAFWPVIKCGSRLVSLKAGGLHLAASTYYAEIMALLPMG